MDNRRIHEPRDAIRKRIALHDFNEDTENLWAEIPELVRLFETSCDDPLEIWSVSSGLGSKRFKPLRSSRESNDSPESWSIWCCSSEPTLLLWHHNRWTGLYQSVECSRIPGTQEVYRGWFKNSPLVACFSYARTWCWKTISMPYSREHSQTALLWRVSQSWIWKRSVGTRARYWSFGAL